MFQSIRGIYGWCIRFVGRNGEHSLVESRSCHKSVKIDAARRLLSATRAVVRLEDASVFEERQSESTRRTGYRYDARHDSRRRESQQPLLCQQWNQNIRNMKPSEIIQTHEQPNSCGQVHVSSDCSEASLKWMGKQLPDCRTACETWGSADGKGILSHFNHS